MIGLLLAATSAFRYLSAQRETITEATQMYNAVVPQFLAVVLPERREAMQKCRDMMSETERLYSHIDRSVVQIQAIVDQSRLEIREIQVRISDNTFMNVDFESVTKNHDSMLLELHNSLERPALNIVKHLLWSRQRRESVQNQNAEQKYIDQNAEQKYNDQSAEQKYIDQEGQQHNDMDRNYRNHLLEAHGREFPKLIEASPMVTANRA
jgi:hypothetical protein